MGKPDPMPPDLPDKVKENKEIQEEIERLRREAEEGK